MATKEEPKPTAADYEAPSVGVNPEYGEPDENGFVGVSPEYANYANVTDAPMNPEEGDDEDTDYSEGLVGGVEHDDDTESQSATHPASTTLGDPQAPFGTADSQKQ